METIDLASFNLIDQWQIQDFPLGGANLQCVHFSGKMYAKMKEIDPVGGARAGGANRIR